MYRVSIRESGNADLVWDFQTEYEAGAAIIRIALDKKSSIWINIEKIEKKEKEKP